MRAGQAACIGLVLWGCSGDRGCGGSLVKPEGSDAAIAAALDSGAALQPERARLVASHGEVTLTREATTAPAQPGALRLKDVLETGTAAGAEIRFADGRAVTLGENARFFLDEENGSLTVNLALGVMLTRVPQDAADGGLGVEVVVKTPYGLTRLGNGPQEVEVTVGDVTGLVDVRVGQVEMVGRDGKSTRASAGDKLELSAGKVELVSRTPMEKLPLKLDTLKVVVKGVAGAEVKPKGASRWRKVSLKGEALEEGMSLRTGRTPARLLIGSARTSLEVGSSSEVLFTAAGGQGNRVESTLDLKKGRLIHTARKGTQTSLDLTAVKLADDGNGNRYEVKRNGSTYEVRAVAGDLTATRDGKDETISAGAIATLRPGKAAGTEALDTASLRLVSRAGQKIFHPGLAEVTLGWPGETGEYAIEVAEDPKFEQVLVEGAVHAPQITVPAPRRGGLYWRARNQAGDEARGSAAFAPEANSNELQRLRNEVPDGSEKTTIFFQDKPPAVTFTFDPVENATHYKFSVFRVTELTSPLAERDTNESRVRLDEGTLAEGNYVWSVTPLAASGSVLQSRGRMNKLEMVYDNALPTLVIAAPRNGDSAKDKVQARGIAPLGSRVYINGKPAPLDDKGRFDTPAFPQGNPPVIIFKLTRPGEVDSVTVRALR